MKPKIAIITSLSDAHDAFSLVSVIKAQCRMFAKNGYDYTLFCESGFNEKDKQRLIDEGINVEFVLAHKSLYHYEPDEPPRDDEYDFKKQVEAFYYGDSTGMGYKTAVEQYDVVITHDLMFIAWHLPQNQALRYCIRDNPTKLWLHWTHSAPSPRPNNCIYPSELRYTAEPHSKYVTLNYAQRHDLANCLSTTDSSIHVIYNPCDIRQTFGFCKQTCDFIDRYKLFEHEYLQVYPFSLPRWTSKGVKALVKIWKHFRASGKNARLVFVNAHSNGEHGAKLTDKVKRYCESNDLIEGNDVVFTSLYAKERVANGESKEDWEAWEMSVPNRVVRELMIMSNLFVFPSISECCSLVQADAATMGKYLVLNTTFLPMLEFAPHSIAKFPFSANNPDTNETFFKCVAKELIGMLDESKIFQATTLARTRNHNEDWIFTNQLEPLLYVNRSSSVASLQQAL